ncbi:MAG: peptidase S14 [Archangium gephyra]|uniref:Peptidase S14 n=1 Tax=Archangium gephyra TaxID=48 RepID=A0A2W5UU30_9BACT|nr:MAG: peptidase S14 [Archangium gephyra]
MKTSETKQVPPQSRRAEISKVDVEKRTFEVVWTTGAKVLRSSWIDGRHNEELSVDPAHVRMQRFTSGRSPFLKDHATGNVAETLGVIESARLEKGRGVAAIRFAKEGIDPEADKVFAKIADRIINNVSVGYRTFKVEKIESVEAQIPTIRAIDWEPYEISVVAIGADADAFVRSDATTTNPCEFLNTRSTERNDMSTGAQDNITQAVTAERERIAGIQSAVRAAGLGEGVATRMINDNTGLDAARAFVLGELAKREEQAPIVNQRFEVGDTAEEKFERGASAAIIAQTNPGLAERAVALNVEGFDARDFRNNPFRGLSVTELAREALDRQNVRTRGLSKNQILGEAFTRRGGPYAGIADFPVLLENAIGKILLAAYATTPDTWSRICKVESTDDFRPSSRYRPGSFGTLDTVPENSEFKNLAIPDGSKLSIQTETKGKIIAITRQALVNDDLGAFQDLAPQAGRAAKLSIEKEFYALLAQNSGLGPTVNGNPFFHSSNGNVNGTGSALSVAGLDADRLVMAQQKDASNNEVLDLKPSILLVPSSLVGAAKVLVNAQYDPDAPGQLQRPNMVNGIVKEIVDTSRITGPRRYLFADPNLLPAFVVAFLNGQQNPTIESKDGWRVDGTELKVRFDFKVNHFDPKGAVTNAGA